MYKENKNALLVLVGQGPLVDEMKNKCNELNISEKLRKRVDMICKFAYVKPTYKNGNIYEKFIFDCSICPTYVVGLFKRGL